jgi:hypothetical protein
VTEIQHHALGRATRAHLDELIAESETEVRATLATAALATRELWDRSPPWVRALATRESVRAVIQQRMPVLLVDLANRNIEANEAAMWNYIDALLGPVARSADPEVVLESWWRATRAGGSLTPERAFELGKLDPHKVPDRLTRWLRRAVKRDAWKQENSYGKRRRGRAKLGALDKEIPTEARRAVERGEKFEGVWRPQTDTVPVDEATGGTCEGPAEATDTARDGTELLLSEVEAVAKNQRERDYASLLAFTDLNQSEAARKAGLTIGQGKAFRERVARRLKKNQK